jgi:hypothetical protein
MFFELSSLRSQALRGLLVLQSLLVASSSLYGDLIVFPGSATSVEGNVDSNLPFSVALYSFSTMRYQQIYGSAEFAAIPGPQLISAISFRPDSLTGNAFTEGLTNIQINLSTTQAQPDNLSAVFANNVGPDDTMLHSGPLVLSSAFSGPLNGPKDFDITINFSTPFLYDPSAGRLLLDIRSFAGGSIRPFDAFFVANDSVSRVMTWIGQNVNSPSGNVVDTVGLATRFTTIAIPEPSAMLLTVIAAGIVGQQRRRKSLVISN